MPAGEEQIDGAGMEAASFEVWVGLKISLNLFQFTCIGARKRIRIQGWFLNRRER
jgi:hypothetical protein